MPTTVGNVGGFPGNAGRSGGFSPGGVYQGPYGQTGFADVSAVQTGPQWITPPPAPPVSTLTDDFATQDTSKWTGWSGNVSVVSGQLNIACASAYFNLQSVRQYALRDSIMTVEIAQIPNLGTGTTSLYFQANVDGSNNVGIDWQSGVMEAFYTVAGVRNTVSITYNATAHRIWRIRESGGTLYWEASSTGASWTSLRASIPTPLNLTAISAYFASGYYGTETAPGTGIFDNFNAAYADPPPAPRTLYVDPAGSDSNDGLTTATAWATVSKATNTLLYPGDVVSFKRGGTWTGNLAVTGSGTLANPITVTNYGSGALPIISGGGSSGVAGTINPCEVYGSFVIIDGIEFRGGLKDNVYVIGTDCAVQNCTVRWGSFGVHQSAQAARLDVLNNTIADINVGIIGPGTNDDGGAMGVLLEGDSAEVAYNTISGCIYASPDYGLDGSSIECYGTTNAVVHHNYCSGSPSGMEFGNPPGTTVQNNCTFYDNVITSSVAAGNGFTIHGALYDDGATTDIYGPVLGSKVYHNTVYLAGGDSTASGIWVSPSGEVDLQNNVIVVAGNSKMASIGVSSRTITEAGNVFWNTAGNTSNIAVDGTSTIDPTSTIADPLFVSSTDLRLLPGSPAVDRGGDVGVGTDYLGIARPIGAAPDAGAYEGVIPAAAFTGAGDLSGSGTLTVAQTAVATAAVSSLSGTGALSATTTPVSTSPAALAGSGTLTSTQTVTVATTAALTGTGTPTAATAPAATQTAAPSGSGALATTQTAAAARTAALAGSGALTATQTLAQTQAAAATGSGALTATTTPGVAVAALLTGSGSLAATNGAVTTTAPASLTGSGALTSTAQTPTATTAAALTGTGSLSTTGYAPATTTTAALSGTGMLSASNTVVATATGAGLTGAGGLTVNAAPDVKTTATLAGSGTLTGSQTLTATTAATLAGSGSLATSQTLTAATPAASTGSGTLAAATGGAYVRSGDLTGSGTLAAATTALSLAATAALTGSGVVAATQTASTTTPAALAGSGTLTATSVGAGTAAAPLGGAGTLTASLTPAITSTAALTGTGSLTATTSTAGAAAAAMSGAGALTAATNPAATTTAAATGSGGLTADASAEQGQQAVADAHLAGLGILTAVSTARLAVDAHLTGIGVLATLGVPALSTAASLTGSGALSATAARSGGVTDDIGIDVATIRRGWTATALHRDGSGVTVAAPGRVGLNYSPLRVRV